MKKTKLEILAILAIALVLNYSCKKKNVNAEDFSATVAENPASGQKLGTINASTEKGKLTYRLLSESIGGALSLDSATGALSVRETSVFNFEVRQTISAVVEITNSGRTAKSNVQITISDVYEKPAVIGEYRDAGVVFWVDPTDNTKGMVCAVTDQTTSAYWGCWDLINPFPAINGADGSAIGTGKQNTMDMTAACNWTGTASDVCTKYRAGGFSDWFLPSRDEMTAIYTNKTAINATAFQNGGTKLNEDELYWTSTEIDGNKAYDFYFKSGESEPTLKLNSFRIRAARNF